MQVRFQKKSGFTLVELLVVIAIIGILVALLLPAVQAAREAARRAECNNKLKQFGLAMQNFHDTYGSLPVGMTDDDNDNFGWGTYVLPFMEQQAIYDRFNAGVTSTPPATMIPTAASHPAGVNIDGWASIDYNNAVHNAAGNAANPARSTVKSFLCPTNILPKFDNDGFGVSHYAGCAGTGPATVQALTGITMAHGCGGAFNGSTMNGVLTSDNNNTSTFTWGMQDITDGTSNTFLVGEVGESSQANRNNLAGRSYPLWVGGNNNGNCTTQDMGGHLRLADATYYLNRGKVQPTMAEGDLSFGSFHVGGANFALADGSVRFVPNTVNTTVYAYAAARNDGQVMGDF